MNTSHHKPAILIPNSHINFNLCCTSTLQVWPHLEFLITAKINYNFTALYFRLLSWSPFHFFLPPPLPLFFPFFHHVSCSHSFPHHACIPTLAFILPIFHLYHTCILHSTFILPSPSLPFLPLLFAHFVPQISPLKTFLSPTHHFVHCSFFMPRCECSATFFVLLISPSIIFADYFVIDLSEILILWQWSLTNWKLHKWVWFPHNSFQICTEHTEHNPAQKSKSMKY